MKSGSAWWAIFAVTWAGLAGCGDDVRTGVFVGGPVIGLRYETLTRSGLTDERGKFEYADTETVTFTVGGVVLGTARGAQRISPFDLFGIVPPTDPAELRALLRDNVLTEFDRAANVALFLQALDADRDPTNGVDVTSSGATLAGVSLGFDESFASFAFGSFARFAAMHPGVDRNIDVAAVLPTLYAALAIEVAGHVPATNSIDYGDDGRIDANTTFSVDSLGRVVLSRSDSSGNGVVDREESIVYGSRGRAINHDFRSDPNEDGVFERIESEAVAFDSDGYRTSRTVQDTMNGVVGLKQVFTFTHDSRGNELTSLQENDNGGNGSIESRRSEARVYDLAGRRLSNRVETDTNGDGAAERIKTETLVWSADGFVAEAVTDADDDADGSIDSRLVVTYTRDPAGRALEQNDEAQNGGVVVSRGHSAFTYDGNGNNLTNVYEEDSNADGTIDYRSTYTATYREDGRRLDEIFTVDSDADGAHDFVGTTTRVYDELANLISVISENDNGGDGVIDTRRTVESTYDASGNEVSRLSRADANNDSTFDSQTREVTTYSEIADGLYRLVFELVGS